MKIDRHVQSFLIPEPKPRPAPWPFIRLLIAICIGAALLTAYLIHP